MANSKRKSANSKQKQWLFDITEYIQDNGFYDLYGERELGCLDFDRHHVLGKTAKQDKIPIGYWFIIPVPRFLHDVHSNHTDNVTHFKHRFTNRFGYQRQIFERLCFMMKEQGYEIPPKDVCDAIKRTRS